MTPGAEGSAVARMRVRVTGVVQGVGFRPFVYGHATRLGLTGFVGNDSAGVLVEAQGEPAAVAEFLDLITEGPALARVDSVTTTSLEPVADVGFTVVASTASDGTTSIPPDTAVCADCLAEMRDPADRRHDYAFIACTNCGPRYTIVTGLPYDRPYTTMADFPLCADCQAEYDDPASRRFHAQPTACPVCGPHLSMPVAEIARLLSDGLIVAMKGVGGYHLACDARNAAAVAALRQRKQRGDKPFALMCTDTEVATAIVDLSDDARLVMESTARPIVLLPARDASLQASAAPGNGYLGVMLPYAPLHYLLFAAGAPDVLVMTSGNLSDEPICITPEEATERLAGIADAMVHHDRRIHVACDDSVVRIAAGRLQPMRRSRGYAPLPIRLPLESPPMVAVGGEIKTTACVARESTAWMSQHVGDTENLETLDALARTVRTLSDLQRVEPRAVVSDRHPGYLSRRWAGEEAARLGVDHLVVQHHHAHVAALLAEHAWPVDEPVLGFAFDGTGFGTDGTIWGGELLLGSYAQVTRVGHLAPVLLPGGDAAVRRPLRTALAHAAAAGIPLDTSLAALREAEPNEVAVVERMIATGTGCVPTTSMGRLFDAVASLLAVRQGVDYEGQAAIELEALAAEADTRAAPAWRMPVDRASDGLVLDPGPVIAAAVQTAREGGDTRTAAYAFHVAVADGVVAAARLMREETGVGVVGLTGGVFANAVLTEGCQGRLVRDGFTVLLHHQMPANDGGLALGQIAVAAAGGASIG